MNNQEVFDAVAIHITEQGGKSLMNDYMCAYRAPDGKRCAIGCLIPDHLYDRGIEGLGINGIYDKRHETGHRSAIMAFFEGVDLRLLHSLQVVHDNTFGDDAQDFVKSFHKLMRRVAEQYDLDASIIDKLEALEKDSPDFRELLQHPLLVRA